MSIEKTKRNLHGFIRNRSQTNKVTLQTLRLWADYNNISRKDMGHALQLLKENNSVYYSQKYGWMVRGNNLIGRYFKIIDNAGEAFVGQIIGKDTYKILRKIPLTSPWIYSKLSRYDGKIKKGDIIKGDKLK